MGTKWSTKQAESAKDWATTVFLYMDVDGDGCITEDEFVFACSNDKDIARILTSYTCLFAFPMKFNDSTHL